MRPPSRTLARLAQVEAVAVLPVVLVVVVVLVAIAATAVPVLAEVEAAAKRLAGTTCSCGGNQHHCS